MKTLKKLAALLLALSMVFALAACSGDEGGAPSADPTNPPETQAPADDTQAPADDTQAPEADPTGAPSEEPAGDGELNLIEPGKLLMVTNAAFPPYEMTDDAGNIIGIDPEIAQAIADKLGLELVIDNIDFDAALISVQENRSDVMLAGLTYKESRDLVMDFTDKYATGYQVIIVKDGDDTIAGTNDDLEIIDADGNKLEDIQIGVQRGTTGEEYCQGAHGSDHVTSLDNGSVAVQYLLNGQVDCVVIDKGPAEEYVKANSGLKILEAEYVIEDYCAAVDEGNTSLLNAVNNALNELIADGTVQNILDKYITAD